MNLVQKSDQGELELKMEIGQWTICVGKILQHDFRLCFPMNDPVHNISDSLPGKCNKSLL